MNFWEAIVWICGILCVSTFVVPIILVVVLGIIAVFAETQQSSDNGDQGSE